MSLRSFFKHTMPAWFAAFLGAGLLFGICFENPRSDASMHIVKVSLTLASSVGYARAQVLEYCKNDTMPAAEAHCSPYVVGFELRTSDLLSPLPSSLPDTILIPRSLTSSICGVHLAAFAVALLPGLLGLIAPFRGLERRLCPYNALLASVAALLTLVGFVLEWTLVRTAKRNVARLGLAAGEGEARVGDTQWFTLVGLIVLVYSAVSFGVAWRLNCVDERREGSEVEMKSRRMELDEQLPPYSVEDNLKGLAEGRLDRHPSNISEITYPTLPAYENNTSTLSSV